VHHSGHGVNSGHDLPVGNTVSAAPQQHLGAREGWCTVRSSGGAARSKLEQARREMERGAAMEGARR
jgi:hypothetical protein